MIGENRQPFPLPLRLLKAGPRSVTAVCLTRERNCVKSCSRFRPCGALAPSCSDWLEGSLLRCAAGHLVTFKDWRGGGMDSEKSMWVQFL